MTSVSQAWWSRPVRAGWAWAWWALLAAAALGHVLVVRRAGLIDLGVYLDGVARNLDGSGLYVTPPGALPYTYPPFSAFFFLPMHPVPEAARPWVWSLLTLACLARTLLLVVDHLTGRRGRPLAGGPSAGAWGQGTVPLYALAVPLLLWVPVRETLMFGQINAVLAWLVAEDLLGSRRRWWAGAGIGVAAAVKLTPLIFVGVLLFTAWRMLGLRALAWFAGVTALTWAVRPAESLLYWTVLLREPSRIGGQEYIHNQSLNGWLWRLTGPGGVPWVWFVLSAALGLATIVLVRRAVAAGDAVVALSLTSLAMLVTSPVSWSHHWVWILPTLGWLAWRAAETRSGAALAALLAAGVVFSHLELDWFPHDDRREWTMGPALLAASGPYVVWALAVLAGHAVVARSRPAA